MRISGLPLVDQSVYLDDFCVTYVVRPTCTLIMAPTNNQLYKTRQLTGAKAPKAKVARYLKSTEAVLREPGKNALLLQGISCSQTMTQVLKELRAVQAPRAKLLTKKNQIVPFSTSGQQSLEFLTTKNDCALLALASHNKKRPNNLILGRTFDRTILDLCELGVLRFKSMHDYGGSVPKKRIGSKPLLLFVGDGWEQSSNLDARNLRNLLVDFYRGDVVDKLTLSGIDHAIVFTWADVASSNGIASRSLIHQRTYFVKLKKNVNSSINSSAPLPQLIPSGPDLDLVVRRSQWAESDLYQAARKQPSSAKPKKTKNHSTNMFGETIGRLHVTKQDVDGRQGRKVKALRRAEKIANVEEKAAIEAELEQEKSEMSTEFKATFGFAENQ